MSAENYQIGIGAADITPQLGAQLVGGVAPFASDGVATPLCVKTLAVSDSKQTVLMVTLDNLKYPPSEEAVSRIAEETGIPEENIWVTASHSHSCPYFTDYGDELVEAMIRSSKDALADRTSCNLYTAKTVLKGLTGNRRVIKNDQCVNIWLLPKDERALWPEAGWPAAGACDQDVITLAAEDASGKYKAILFNFACHACTSGATPTLISADYPGFAREKLNELLGYPTQTAFWPGACGDINACCDSKKLGESLAAAIAESLHNKKQVTGDISVLSRHIMLKDREVSAFQEEAVANLWGSSMEHFRESFEEAQSFRQDAYRVRLSVLRIGDFLAAGIPGELFSEIGLAIKDAFGEACVMVAEQTNGAIGYIPTEKGFRQGGYEALYGEHSVVAIGAGEIVLKESLNMLKKISANKQNT